MKVQMELTAPATTPVHTFLFIKSILIEHFEISVSVSVE